MDIPNNKINAGSVDSTALAVVAEARTLLEENGALKRLYVAIETMRSLTADKTLYPRALFGHDGISDVYNYLGNIRGIMSMKLPAGRTIELIALTLRVKQRQTSVAAAEQLGDRISEWLGTASAIEPEAKSAIATQVEAYRTALRDLRPFEIQCVEQLQRAGQGKADRPL